VALIRQKACHYTGNGPLLEVQNCPKSRLSGESADSTAATATTATTAATATTATTAAIAGTAVATATTTPKHQTVDLSSTRTVWVHGFDGDEFPVDSLRNECFSDILRNYSEHNGECELLCAADSCPVSASVVLSWYRFKC
jgi:hypothetical protein